jgi:uncharacterized protein (DUF1778 family)
MGRKKLPPDLELSDRLQYRATAEEHELILAAAEAQGQTLSEFTRAEVVKAAKRIVRKAEREGGDGE